MFSYNKYRSSCKILRNKIMRGPVSFFYLSRYNNNFKIKNKIKLTDMWTASCVDEVGEGNTNAMKSFVLGWPTVNFVATFR